MLAATQTWDVRCPRELRALFPIHRGYWFKVDRKRARVVLAVLARVYKIKPPQVTERTPDEGANGWYHPKSRSISIHSRAHLKTVFHEFYHHLDFMTEGKYNSSDNPVRKLTLRGQRTSGVSLAWQFAEKLFDLMRANHKHPADDPQKEVVASLAARIEHVELIDALRELEKEHGAGFRFLPAQVRAELVHNYLKEKSMAKKTDDKKTEKQSKKLPMPELGVAKVDRASVPREAKAPEAPALATAKTLDPKAAKAEVAKKTPAPAAAPKEKKAPKAPKGTGFPEGAKIKVLPALKKFLEDTGNKSSKAYECRTFYKDGMTVEQFQEKCQTHGCDWTYIRKDATVRALVAVK
jgi:hypothetical protein